MVELEHRQTPFGTIAVWRSLSDGSLLYLQGAGVQSQGDRKGESSLGYIRAICALTLLLRTRSVLLLGSGGGTLATMLVRRGIDCTAVDVNPASFEIARTHFGLPAEVRCVVADALEFLAGSDDRYDCIVVDAYSGFAIPDHLVSVDLGTLCRRRLTAGGTILANVVIAHRWDGLPDRFGRLLAGPGMPLTILDTRAPADDNVLVMAGRLPPEWRLPAGSCTGLSDALAAYRRRRTIRS